MYFKTWSLSSDSIDGVSVRNPVKLVSFDKKIKLNLLPNLAIRKTKPISIVGIAEVRTHVRYLWQDRVQMKESPFNCKLRCLLIEIHKKHFSLREGTRLRSTWQSAEKFSMYFISFIDWNIAEQISRMKFDFYRESEMLKMSLNIWNTMINYLHWKIRTLHFFGIV